MPMSNEFKQRLYPILKDVIAHFDTPFHIYDETGIEKTGRALMYTFSKLHGFKEYFAVKALPNPRIMEIMRGLGFGFDCSSTPELILSRKVGARGEEIMFTSNNTTQAEFAAAFEDGGCILTLDDISLIDRLPAIPELICFRYNPGPRRTGNAIIGNPEEAKYGVSHDQILDAYRKVKKRGASRFGLHTMLVSNERDYAYMVETARMLLNIAEWISRELRIRFEFVNIGGGLGIPYLPDDPPLDLKRMGEEILGLFEGFSKKHGYAPKLYMESGRYMTGPHGVLVTTAINRKDIYRTHIGVDACMSALMRPGIYGAYHHIEVFGKDIKQHPLEKVDVVGALCENIDKFAIQRELPKIETGDVLIIQDTGAHGHAMGFNYNARLRPKELLLEKDGAVSLIRREETPADYFATLDFKQDVLRLKQPQQP